MIKHFNLCRDIIIHLENKEEENKKEENKEELNKKLKKFKLYL